LVDSPQEKEFRRSIDFLEQWGTHLIEQRLATADLFSENFECKSFLDFVLQQIGKDSTAKERTDWIFALVDLVLAGSESTATNVIWILTSILAHPHVTRKVVAEIDSVLGGRPPVHEDMKAMNYVRAAIYENLRYRPSVTVGLPRLVTCADGELQLGGYDIPHGTAIFPNQIGMFQDARFWENPKDFIPERFLNEDRKFTDNKLYPFGLGSRMCAGVNLAEVEMFLMVVSLFQNFDLELPRDYEFAKSVQVGLAIRPKNNKLELKVSRRNSQLAS